MSDTSKAFRTPVRIRRIDAWSFRVAIERPVETSFGIMHSRPAVFVRLEAEDGSFGFGEIWCNFPSCGAEHRVAMAIEELGPLLTAGAFTSPTQAFDELTKKIHVRILQTAEPGPYNQAIAGIDIALWDLAARQAGLPVRTFINADAVGHVPVYSSGIHIGIAEQVIDEARAEGVRNFKVKVGFNIADDLAALERLSPMIADGERLFSDANQAWDIEQALAFTKGAADTGLGWLEEPLRADAPVEHWQQLAAEGGVPLAAGENITGAVDFQCALDAGYLSYVQPDMAKWGGFSANLPVIRAIQRAGVTYCPHYLGGGIGLLASAHLLAAAGGNGILEVDTNPNPLRAEIPGTEIRNGSVIAASEPGLGIEDIPQSLMQHVTLHRHWQD